LNASRFTNALQADPDSEDSSAAHTGIAKRTWRTEAKLNRPKSEARDTLSHDLECCSEVNVFVHSMRSQTGGF